MYIKYTIIIFSNNINAIYKQIVKCTVDYIYRRMNNKINNGDIVYFLKLSCKEGQRELRNKYD